MDGLPRIYDRRECIVAAERGAPGKNVSCVIHETNIAYVLVLFKRKFSPAPAKRDGAEAAEAGRGVFSKGMEATMDDRDGTLERQGLVDRQGLAHRHGVDGAAAAGGGGPPAARNLQSPATGELRLPIVATDLSGSKDVVFSRWLGEQVVRCVRLPETIGPDEEKRRITATLGAFREVGAQNGLEGLLAAQMAAVQTAGLDFLSRAVNAEHSKLADVYARRGSQLMTLFVRQMEQLQRQRGRRRQSLRVAHERIDADGRTSVSAEQERTE